MTVFEKKDYDSNDGFLVQIFGPPQWMILHTISFNYKTNPTEIDKQNYYNYIISLTNILPCSSCRKNLNKNLKDMKFGMQHMKNRETFSKFIYDLHNVVNVMLGKPKYKTYEEVRDIYEMFRAHCINSTPMIPKHIEGCVVPLYGVKSKTLISIVPNTDKSKNFSIDPKCILSRIPKNQSSKTRSSKTSKTQSSKTSKKSKSKNFKN